MACTLARVRPPRASMCISGRYQIQGTRSEALICSFRQALEPDPIFRLLHRQRAPTQNFVPQRREAVRCQISGGDRRKGFGAEVKSSEEAQGAAQSAERQQAPDTPSTPADLEFERRLAAIKRGSTEKKSVPKEQGWGALDYDSAPEEAGGEKGGRTAFQVGAGIAAAFFVVVFAFGDIFPSSSPGVRPEEEASLSAREKAALQLQVERFEGLLKMRPGDRDAVEGLAVSYAELGAYDKAAEQLLRLTKDGPEDADVIRLLAEVRSAQGQYAASAEEYRRAIRASGQESLGLLQGLSEALIAGGKQEEAVGELLAAKARLQRATTGAASKPAPSAAPESRRQDGSAAAASLDPVQVELLLGRAYAAASQPEQAVAVYDGIISAQPEDFRGYLAKALIRRNQGNTTEAERLFAKARFLAPERAKAVVDRVASKGPP